MSITLWSYIYSFKEFVCLTAIVVIVFALYILMKSKKTDYPKNIPFVTYYMFQTGPKKLFYAIFSLLQTLFIISCVIFQKNIQDIFLVFISLLSILLIFFGYRIANIFFELFNTVFLFIGLITQNIMFRYLYEIKFEWMVLSLYIILNFFLVLYVVYLCVYRLNATHQSIQGKESVIYEE